MTDEIATDFDKATRKATLFARLKAIAIAAVSAAIGALATYFGLAACIVVVLVLNACAMLDKGAGAIVTAADTDRDGLVSDAEAKAFGDKAASVTPSVPGFPWLETIVGGAATVLAAGAGAYTVKRRKDALAEAVVKTVEASENADGVKASFAANRIPEIEKALTKSKRL